MHNVQMMAASQAILAGGEQRGWLGNWEPSAQNNVSANYKAGKRGHTVVERHRQSGDATTRDDEAGRGGGSDDRMREGSEKVD